MAEILNRCVKDACVDDGYFRCALEHGHKEPHNYRRERMPPELQHRGRGCMVAFVVENPEAIGDPNQTPRVRLEHISPEGF